MRSPACTDPEVMEIHHRRRIPVANRRLRHESHDLILHIRNLRDRMHQRVSQLLQQYVPRRDDFQHPRRIIQKFLAHLPPLFFITLQQTLAGSIPHCRNLPRQVCRVLNPRVHSLSRYRRMNVRRVARQENVPLPDMFRVTSLTGTASSTMLRVARKRIPARSMGS